MSQHGFYLTSSKRQNFWWTETICVHMLSCFSCVLLFVTGSSAHGILQARILELLAMPSSMGSSQPMDQTHISYVFCIGRQVQNFQAPREKDCYAKSSRNLLNEVLSADSCCKIPSCSRREPLKSKKYPTQERQAELSADDRSQS